MFFLKLKHIKYHLNNFHWAKTARTFLLLSILITVYSCDKHPDEIIDYQFADFQVVNISAPANFVYSASDSLLNVSLQIKNGNSVEKVLARIKIADATQKVISEINLNKTQSLQSIDEYAGKFKMSKTIPSGKYILEFFVINNVDQNSKKVAEHLFNYDSNQKNYPPVISNLKIPSSVLRGESFVFSIKVDDQNGLNDILQVTFKLYRPDGSVVLPNASNPNIDYFIMVDNGDLNLGDEKAGDGIYSFKNSFGQSSSVGNWKFEFQAKDRSGAMSNVITSSLEVK
ncbi:MAG: hypothetical protein HZA74_04555 [Ignavibacteriales bacterium]|nr:hypothetical protein [Ignavibacteriales bacterium]